MTTLETRGLSSGMMLYILAIGSKCDTLYTSNVLISYYDFGVYEESFCAVGTQGAFQLRHAKKYKLWEHTL